MSLSALQPFKNCSWLGKTYLCTFLVGWGRSLWQASKSHLPDENNHSWLLGARERFFPKWQSWIALIARTDDVCKLYLDKFLDGYVRHLFKDNQASLTLHNSSSHGYRRLRLGWHKVTTLGITMSGCSWVTVTPTVSFSLVWFDIISVGLGTYSKSTSASDVHACNSSPLTRSLIKPLELMWYSPARLSCVFPLTKRRLPCLSLRALEGPSF